MRRLAFALLIAALAAGRLHADSGFYTASDIVHSIENNAERIRASYSGQNASFVFPRHEFHGEVAPLIEADLREIQTGSFGTLNIAKPGKEKVSGRTLHILQEQANYFFDAAHQGMRGSLLKEQEGKSLFFLQNNAHKSFQLTEHAQNGSILTSRLHWNKETGRLEKFTQMLLAPGAPKTMNSVRLQVHKTFNRAGWSASTLIWPTPAARNGAAIENRVGMFRFFLRESRGVYPNGQFLRVADVMSRLLKI